MPPDPLLRAFVVDDERLAVERLCRLLMETGRVSVAGSATDPEVALKQLQEGLAVDVIFLDVQMPEMSGFDLLARLDADTPVVFTTAYDQYAIEAFAVNSVDYLLKPIEPARLDRALDKLQRFTGEARPDVRLLARELAAHLTPGRKLERIASRVVDRTIVLDVARVSHVVARDKQTFAALGGREHAIDYTLTQLEQRLDPRRFVRVHRGAMVNVAYVDEIYPDVDGGMLVRLKDEKKTEISVARDRVKSLKERLGI
jgi:two-component system, LytTR family, response regulator